MDNKFTKADYEKAARMMRSMPELDCFKKVDENDTWIFVSDLLENAITNIEIIEHYFHSTNPVISKRCDNCGQKLRVKIDDNKSKHRLDN